MNGSERIVGKDGWPIVKRARVTVERPGLRAFQTIVEKDPYRTEKYPEGVVPYRKLGTTNEGVARASHVTVQAGRTKRQEEDAHAMVGAAATSKVLRRRRISSGSGKKG